MIAPEPRRLEHLRARRVDGDFHLSDPWLNMRSLGDWLAERGKNSRIGVVGGRGPGAALDDPLFRGQQRLRGRSSPSASGPEECLQADAEV